MSRIILKRYRWLWLLLVIILIVGLFVGNKKIVSYDFSGFSSGLSSDEVVNNNSVSRDGHPRMELFDEGVDSIGTIDTENTEKTGSVDQKQDAYLDWKEETHSDLGKSDYDIVFPQEKVNRLDVVISQSNWQLMIDDMNEKYGNSNDQKSDRNFPINTGEENMDGFDRNMPIDGQEMPPMDMLISGDDRMPPPDLLLDDKTVGGGGMDIGGGSDENPIFVESQVFFNDTQWYNVGIRFKGNSSLSSAWQQGNLKLPFKLDFDEFEDDYPVLNNQRFYGFKQLALSSAYKDTSFLHEKLATEVFDAAGIPSPESAFYELYIDYGDGPVYFGLYTAVEVIDNSVIKSDFDDDGGNLYKAIDVDFTTGNLDTIQEGLDKKSNEDEDDWSDVQELAIILNSGIRLTDPVLWKEQLESIFDVDNFLNWLAVNTTIQNWDTYGVMNHNYYLYNNPDFDKLVWVPWDNNESFDSNSKSFSLTLNGAGDKAPLIRYLIDDEEYKEKYISYVYSFVEDILDTDEFKERVSFLHELIEPYAILEIDGYTHLKNNEEFTSSLSELLEHIENRISIALNLSLDSDWEYKVTVNSREGGGMGMKGEGRGINDNIESGNMVAPKISGTDEEIGSIPMVGDSEDVGKQPVAGTDESVLPPQMSGGNGGIGEPPVSGMEENIGRPPMAGTGELEGQGDRPPMGNNGPSEM